MVRNVNLSNMKPYNASIDLDRTALIVIDMQIDFLQPGGFGAKLGNDVSKLTRAIEPTQRVLHAARRGNTTTTNETNKNDGVGGGLGLIIHTREGHRPDLTDLHPAKLQRAGAPSSSVVIGTDGPNGRILVRGEPGHDIIPELYPIAGEPVVDKPGKGSFYATDLEAILKARNIETLVVCGVTTEVCVHTTIREANDRGFRCIMLEDCCASFSDKFHEAAVEMIVAQGGIFGSVTDSHSFIDALNQQQQQQTN